MLNVPLSAFCTGMPNHVRLQSVLESKTTLQHSEHNPMVSLTKTIDHRADLSESELNNFRYLHERVSASEMQVDPWPYFEVENIFPPELYSQILANWPESESFNTLPSLVPGQDMCYLTIEDFRQDYHMDPDRTKFWESFVGDWSYPLVLANIAKYSWMVAARFGGRVSKLSTQTLNMMQHGPDYQGQDAHNHYNHNVNWLCTFLIYIGDETDPGAGTGIHGFDDPDWYFNYHAALQRTVPFGSPIEGTHLKYRSEFKGNKLISMADSPVTIHSGTPPCAPPETLNRRIIRFHVGVPNEDVERSYGCTRQEFFANFSNKELGQPMLEGIRKDIDVARLATNREKYQELSLTRSLVIDARPALLT